MPRGKLCYWCEKPITKWIALNDSSDNFCSWQCQNRAELDFELELVFYEFQRTLEYL